MANPSQLYLLADHIKLSLLERQRALSLNLEPNVQDGHISRSLDSMRDGISALEQEQEQEQAQAQEQEQARLAESGDSCVIVLVCLFFLTLMPDAKAYLATVRPTCKNR